MPVLTECHKHHRLSCSLPVDVQIARRHLDRKSLQATQYQLLTLAVSHIDVEFSFKVDSYRAVVDGVT